MNLLKEVSLRSITSNLERLLADTFPETTLAIDDDSEVRMDISGRTGIASVDAALGRGYPSGVIEIYGEESSGKTALGAHILRSAQEDRKIAALCCSEYFDPPYYETIGVDLHDLVLIKGTLEGASETILRFLSHENRIVVLDSFTALRPKDDSDWDSWNKAAFKFLVQAAESIRIGSTLVVINQVRFWNWGKLIESSAKWVHDMFAVRIQLSRENVQENDYTMVVNIVSNQSRRPSVVVKVPATKGFGVDALMDLLRLGVEVQAIQKNGSFYYFPQGQMARGEKEAVVVLTARKDLQDKIKKMAGAA